MTKKLNDTQFKLIKTLQSSKVKTAVIADLAKVHGGTVSRVAKYSTLNEYIEGERALKAAWKARQANASNETVEDELTKDMFEPISEPTEPVVTRLQQQDAGHLLRIAEALERLADAWEAQPKKRSLF